MLQRDFLRRPRLHGEEAYFPKPIKYTIRSDPFDCNSHIISENYANFYETLVSYARANR